MPATAAPTTRRRWASIVAILAAAASCSKSTTSAPAAPTAPAAPAARPTYTLSGTVTDQETGRGIEGATITIFDSENVNKKTTTAADGSFSLPGLASAGFSFRTAATGYSTTSRSVTLTSDVRVTVALSPSTRTISGVVTDVTSHGRLPNILIDAYGLGPTVSTQTDAQGAYSVTVGRDSIELVAHAPSYEFVERTVPAGGSTRVDFEMPRAPLYLALEFDGIGGHGASFTTYSEGSLSVRVIEGAWFNVRNDGNPQPCIEARPGTLGKATIEITAGGVPFKFDQFDYSQSKAFATALYEGWRNGFLAFNSDIFILPVTNGAFNGAGSFSRREVDRLQITVFGPNTVRIDNIILER